MGQISCWALVASAQNRDNLPLLLQCLERLRKWEMEGSSDGQRGKDATEL